MLEKGRFFSTSARRLLPRAAVAAALVAALAWALLSSVPVRALDALSVRAWTALRERLHDDVRLVACARLSDARPVNMATSSAAVLRGAARVGRARRFSGRPDELLLFRDVRWNVLAENGGTVFFRLNAADASEEQRLVWEKAGGDVFGVRLRDGAVEAVFTDSGGVHRLGAPFGACGRMAKIAFSLSRERAALFVDGGEVASCAVAPGRLGFGPHAVAFGPAPNARPVCDLAAFAVWSRPLSAAEVAALPDDPGDVFRHLPLHAAAVAAADGALAAWRFAARLAGHLVPPSRRASAAAASVPVLSLSFSKRDKRHFLSAFSESLASGFRTRRAGRTRSISVSFLGRVFPAEASLADVFSPPGRDVRDAVDERPRRPAFLLHTPPGAICGGSGVALLYPPELYGVFHPDARKPLPLDPSLLVSVLAGGERRGLFVLEPFDRNGSAWMALGAHDPSRRDRVFFTSMPAVPPGENGLSSEDADRRFGDVLSIFATDAAFRWSPAEARWRARRHARAREAAAYPVPRLSALDFAGANPSPMYVTGDLDLSPAGEGVAWRSSRPDVLSRDGRLLARPADPAGTPVEMLAVFPDSRKRVFRFRVMPPEPALPALFLHVAQPVERGWRTDFTAVRRPAGAASGEPEFLSGTGDNGGGLHHRGNTSYVKGAKRSLSLEFDRPVEWSGAPDPSSHLLLLSGYADPTRLRNALCYHAFRALGPRNAATCVPVSWTELYVNGEYYGVWETCPRLRDVVSPDAASLLKIRSSHGLWTSVSSEMTDDAMNGKGPAADPYGEFEELSRFVVEASDAAFAARWRELFDEDNLADFLLLLNFTGNEDGKTSNQYVMRRRSDGRFAICPWDYDKTFLEGHDRGTELGNELLGRVLRADPGFRARCAARWAAARAGALSDAALSAWIGARAAAIAPAMRDEWDLLRPAGFDGDFAEAVETLRREVLRRAARVDAAFSP